MVDANTCHANHVQCNHATIGELKSGCPRREGGALRSHHVGDRVERLSGGGGAHQLAYARHKLTARLPVVVDATIARVGRGHKGSLFGSRRIFWMRTCVDAPATHGEHFASLQGFAHQARVVPCINDLHLRSTNMVGPFANET